MKPEKLKQRRLDAEKNRLSSGLFRQRIEAIERHQAKCTGCKYEIDHNGKNVCRTMTRTHGERCEAYKESDK